MPVDPSSESELGGGGSSVDFEGFGIWTPAECVLRQHLFSFKTSKLEPSLLSRSG